MPPAVVEAPFALLSKYCRFWPSEKNAGSGSATPPAVMVNMDDDDDDDEEEEGN